MSFYRTWFNRRIVKLLSCILISIAVLCLLVYTLSILKASLDNKEFSRSLRPNNPEAEKKVDDLVTSMPDKMPFMGVILMAKDDNVLVSKGYGRAHIGSPELNTSKTVFPLSQITMYFTAAAIMQLQEQGKLNINDKVSKYVPDFPNADKIMIHQLLSHTSGIVNEDPLVSLSTKYRKDKTAEALVRLNKKEELLFEPGKGYNYTFTNYFILGYIIEQVSGMKYKEYMDKYVFKPLHMTATGVYMVKSDEHTIARGHMQESFNHLFIPQAFYNMHACNSLFSSAEDLYRWDRALHTEKLLTRESIDTMHSPYVKEGKVDNRIQTPELLTLDNYGYGLGIDSINNHKAVIAEGIDPGLQTVMIRFIEENAVIIILGNNYEAPMINEENIRVLTNILFEE